MEASIDTIPAVQPSPSIAALIVAGGQSLRMGGGLPKPYMSLMGTPILLHTLRVFLSYSQITHVLVVIHPEHDQLYQQAVAGMDGLLPHVIGGRERQDSVRAGLEALAAYSPRKVLIHDAARPMVSHALISRVIDGLATHEGAMPTLAVPDTLRVHDEGVWRDVPRAGVHTIQTPQGFVFEHILAAHEACAGQALTDDIAVLLAHNKKSAIASVEGVRANIKITHAGDIAMAEQMLMKTPRTAMGYDVHRLMAHGDDVAVEKQVIWLGGIALPHAHYLEGHSDADVVLHALTDALLGSIAAGDIGQHFPPSDARWRGADSAQFVRHAVSLVRQAGCAVSYVDITVICEAPKIAPHRDTMRARIAELCQCDMAQVSVKATTTEGLGFTGRKEGIAAQCVITVC